MYLHANRSAALDVHAHALAAQMGVEIAHWNPCILLYMWISLNQWTVSMSYEGSAAQADSVRASQGKLCI
jgi:hypothetical protein